MTAPRSSDISVVRASAAWVVIDKPAGMLSVPGKGPDRADCAVARVATMFPRARGPMVVHRLDMDTSGLMLVALTPDAQRALSEQFARRTVNKTYIAVVAGSPAESAGVVSLRQRLDIDNRPRQLIDDTRGKLAQTGWRIVNTGAPRPGISSPGFETSRDAERGAFTRIEFTPITGRSHQIRLAAATPDPVGLGCPIVGDDLYGAGREPGGRMLLAATALGFTDPATGARVTVTITPGF